MSPQAVLEAITLKVAQWVLIRKGYEKFSLDFIVHNWEAYMRYGPSKIRHDEVVSSSFCILKFNVDGAARGNPGLAGIGGALRNCRG